MKIINEELIHGAAIKTKGPMLIVRQYERAAISVPKRTGQGSIK